MRVSAARPLLLLLALLLGVCGPVWAGADDDAAAGKGITPPADWAIPTQHPLRVVTVRGLWYSYYDVERALARLGGAAITESWHANSWETRAFGLRYFPNSYDALMRRHLLVLCNVPGSAPGPMLRKMLKDYVARGGALLLLGGYYAFDNSYQDTALAEILPVILPEKGSRVEAPGGFSLAAGPDTPGKPFAVSWAEKPKVYWYHTVTPKPEAKVFLTAGGKPLLIAGSYGKGRVAVFAGSVMGDPPANELPFWIWAGWPVVLADTIAWLVEPTRAPAGLDDAALQPYTKKLLGQGVKKYTLIAPTLQALLARCTNAATAKLALESTAALDDDLTLEAMELLDARTRPFTDGALAPLALQLAQSGLPYKSSLGLRLLGAVKAPDAKTVLLDALRTGEVSSEDADELDAGGARATVDPAELVFHVRIGALEGLGRLGDPSTLPELRRTAQQYRKQRSDPADFPKWLSPEDELYQQAVLAQLRCSDAAAAGPAIDMLLENQAVVIRAMQVMDMPQYSTKSPTAQLMIQKVSKQYSRLVARDAEFYTALAAAPPGTLVALAKRLAADDDPRVTRLAFAAFGRAYRGADFAPPPEALDILTGAKVPAVAELAAVLRGK